MYDKNKIPAILSIKQARNGRNPKKDTTARRRVLRKTIAFLGPNTMRKNKGRIPLQSMGIKRID